jgi:hypothetical protein
MFKIKLSFSTGNSIELIRVDCLNGSNAPRISVRGKTYGAHQGAGTFQWSPAVRATACIFLKAKLWSELPPGEPMLSGESGSLAVSLDYAIAKQPGWLLDMFGVMANGRTNARRLFNITNSHRKRSGPVSLSLNPHACPPHYLEIYLDGTSVNSSSVLRGMLTAIESHRSSRPPSKGETSAGTRDLSPPEREDEPRVTGCAWQQTSVEY